MSFSFVDLKKFHNTGNKYTSGDLEGKHRARESAREQRKREIEEINNILIPNIKTKLKEIFPEMDIDFYIKLSETNTHSDGDNEEALLKEYSLEKLNYSQFIAFKYFCGDGLDLNSNDVIIRYYNEKLDNLNKINPQIFMSNVNIDWKLLQLAKKDTSILIPPNPPPLPSPPKRSSPKKYKLTNETLQSAKSKLKPKGPPNAPPLPSPPKRSSPKRSSPKRSSPKKSKLTNETLQSAKSKLKRYIDPKSDNYDLEMAFKDLEKN